MRKVFCLIFCLLFAVNAFGSPLVFKTTKKFADKDFTFGEIARFDASKYRQIRVTTIGKRFDKPISLAIEFALDDKNSLPLFNYQSEFTSFAATEAIDSPPDTLIFRTFANGEYSIYIWASQ